MIIEAIFATFVVAKPIQRPAPSWLFSLIGRERYTGIPYKAEFFSGFVFATAKVAYINRDDHPSFKNLIPLTVNKRPAFSLFQAFR